MIATEGNSWVTDFATVFTPGAVIAAVIFGVIIGWYGYRISHWDAWSLIILGTGYLILRGLTADPITPWRSAAALLLWALTVVAAGRGRWLRYRWIEYRLRRKVRD